MNGEDGAARRNGDLPSFRFSGRSFVLAIDLPRNEQRALEAAIEVRGGTVHAFLNAVTDVLVVGRAEGSRSGAQWAREQIRRGEIYRERWGHLAFVTEEELRGALDVDGERTA